jgi:hypothetical protein
MGKGMYLDTSNAQSLKEKLLLSAVNEFAEYGYEGARWIISSKRRIAVNRRCITTSAIKKIYLSKCSNIPGTIFARKEKS